MVACGGGAEVVAGGGWEVDPWLVAGGELDPVQPDKSHATATARDSNRRIPLPTFHAGVRVPGHGFGRAGGAGRGCGVDAVAELARSTSIVSRIAGFIWCCLLCAGCSTGGGSAVSSTVASHTTLVPCVSPSQRGGEVARLDAATGRCVWLVAANGSVTSVVPDGRGGVFVAGGFTQIGGSQRAYVAHVLASGSVDPAWRPRVWSSVPGRFVQALVAAGDGRVFVAGLKRSPTARHQSLIAINAATGHIDAQWHAGRWVQSVTGLLVYHHRLYFSGTLVLNSSRVIGCVEAVSAQTGTPDLAFRPRVEPIGDIGCADQLAIVNGDLVISGTFLQLDGAPANGLGLVNASTGALIRAWQPHLTRCDECRNFAIVYALSVDRGRIFASIAARRVGSQVRHGLAALDAATASPLTWAPRLTPSTGAALAVVASGGRVYVGGEFTAINHTPRHGFAALDPTTGSVLRSWQPSQASGPILTLAATPTSVYLGAGVAY